MENSPDKKWEGACYCGGVRFTASGPARFSAHCHCPACRRAHAAAFVTWTGFRREQIDIADGENLLTRFDTPTGATRTFCSICGSTLFYESPRWAEEIHVARASLDDDAGFEPDAHVYVDDRAPWWPITDDCPQYGGETGMEEK